MERESSKQFKNTNSYNNIIRRFNSFINLNPKKNNLCSRIALRLVCKLWARTRAIDLPFRVKCLYFIFIFWEKNGYFVCVLSTRTCGAEAMTSFL